MYTLAPSNVRFQQTIKHLGLCRGCDVNTRRRLDGDKCAKNEKKPYVYCWKVIFDKKIYNQYNINE